MKFNFKLSSLFAFVLALGLAQANVAEAARHCSKGKPCGNSCISREDVCHVGQGAADDVAQASESGRKFARQGRERAREYGNSAVRETRDTVKDLRNNDDSSLSVNTRSSSAEQTKAKICKRGKACGNSCIPANAVCHQ